MTPRPGSTSRGPETGAALKVQVSPWPMTQWGNTGRCQAQAALRLQLAPKRHCGRPAPRTAGEEAIESRTGGKDGPSQLA